MPLLAYLDRWNVQPGDDVDVMVSGPPGSCSARLVRIVGGGPRPEGTADAFAFESAGPAVEARIDLQEVVPGSYLRVDEPMSLPDAFTVSCSIWPTTPGRGRQGIWSWGNAASSIVLGLDDRGRLELTRSGPGGHGATSIEAPMLDRQWYLVSAAIDRPSGDIRLTQRCTTDWTQGQRVEAVDAVGDFAAGTGALASTMVLGCAGTVAISDDATRQRPCDVFNGKLGGFHLTSGSDRLVEWDFGVGMDGSVVVDVTGNGHSATLVGSPMRAVTGRSWEGSVLDPALAPEQYDAVYFHDDDVDDMGWTPTFRVTVPHDARSGLYAVSLESADEEIFVPGGLRRHRVLHRRGA